ncbi:MAG TPA: type II toxin-antitoxin system HigB family toxin [Burkholderiaceae bacterium]|nr:type II toxin-antitoxin system HigB family toxin [Burkholderiaceae bacterium]
MRVISRPKLAAFWQQHPASRQALQGWLEDARRAQWTSPQDIKRGYASVSFVAGNRVVFNIKGNDYRLVVAVAYRYRALYIKFVGTHAQYDAINAATVEPRS